MYAAQKIEITGGGSGTESEGRAGAPGDSQATGAGKAWALGFEFIDHNHRALAAELNRVAFDLGRCAACADGVGAEARLLNALEALGGRLRRQCHCEERLMLEMDYPAFDQHKAQHELVLADYAEMLAQIRRGCRKSIAMQALAALKRWLSAHALSEDRALAAYLHRNATAAAV